jgi:hypothetical protein
MTIKQTIFTICARNYYGLAQVLRKSIAASNPDVSFVAFIADGIPDIETGDFGDDAVDALAIMAARVGESKVREMAFKYNLTEFCTALKPFCFEHLFEDLDQQHVIYLDPDIYVFSPLDEVLAILGKTSIVLTPHIIFPSLYEGKRPDSGLMATGIFNLGFLGLSKSPTTKQFLQWWGSRLLDQCFVDGHDALFTDQKWLDFVPALFPESEVCYFRHGGANLAPWNFHERRVTTGVDGSFLVSRRANSSHASDIAVSTPESVDRLLFVHFSGFDYKKFSQGAIAQGNIDGLDIYDDLGPVVECYMRAIQSLKDVVTRFLGRPYAYATFANEVPILAFHRRLYRAAREEDSFLGDPFAVGSGSFFKMLERAGLILPNGGQAGFEKLNKTTLSGVDRKLALFNRLMQFTKRVIGFTNYMLLLRLMRPYSRAESQLHLLGKKFRGSL